MVEMVEKISNKLSLEHIGVSTYSPRKSSLKKL